MYGNYSFKCKNKIIYHVDKNESISLKEKYNDSKMIR
jgi:hypothetical protein